MEDGWISFADRYDTSALLHFCTPDDVGPSEVLAGGDGGGGELVERLSALEQRVAMQEDEIHILKAALADVIRRLHAAPDGTASPPGLLARRGPTKAVGRQGLVSLPSRPSIGNGANTPRKATPPSSYSPTPAKLLGASPNLGKGKRSSSMERLPSSVRRDGSETRGLRGRTASTTSCSGKKPGDSKPKDPVYNYEEGYVKMYLRGRPITMYLPQDMAEDYRLDTKLEPPAEKLKLNWVYGYRGKDCRNNLYLLPTGEMVYFIASVVVLYSPEEGNQRHYLEHNDDVKCLAIHPDRITIATGQVVGTGKDGKTLPAHVRVWDSVSLKTLHVIGTGVFERGILCLAFSKTNCGLLCAVDDGNEHVLSVWDWQQGNKLADIKCSNEAVFAADFHPMDPRAIVTCGKSHVHFWTLEGNSLSKKQGIFEKHDKPKYVLCVTFAENGDAITGDSSGNIFVWGRGTNRITHAIVGAHDGGIFTLCMQRDGTLVSGGKDRRLVTWDTAYRKTGETEIPEAFGPVRTVAEGRGDAVLVGTTRNAVLLGSLAGDFTPVVQGHTDELWGLAVHPLKCQFLTCASDKQAILWDTSTHQPIWIKTLEDPAQSADFHPAGAVLAIGTSTGRWMVFDAETRDLVSLHTDGAEQISVMRYSPDGSFLAVGSHDNFVYVYSVSEGGRKYTRAGKCSGHSSFITHLDWSTDGTYLMSNSGDYEILYWTAASCKQVTSVAPTRDVDWATYTCVLGFYVYGVWSDGSDGTDINALCRSHSRRVLAIADDFGKVQLFPFPSAQPKAPSHVYGGHSSHVTNVLFTRDDSLLLSTGGKDCSVMQWRLS
ncbi:echinoderm microtubule-associated protein-like 2 isoform X2 [Lampetra planeri]